MWRRCCVARSAVLLSILDWFLRLFLCLPKVSGLFFCFVLCRIFFFILFKCFINIASTFPYKIFINVKQVLSSWCIFWDIIQCYDPIWYTFFAPEHPYRVSDKNCSRRKQRTQTEIATIRKTHTPIQQSRSNGGVVNEVNVVAVLHKHRQLSEMTTSPTSTVDSVYSWGFSVAALPIHIIERGIQIKII